MQTYRSHIAQCISAIVLMASLLLPAVVNLVHSAEGHEHWDKCENPSDIHVHEKKLDCKLYDVTLKKNGVFSLVKDVVFSAPLEVPKKTIHTYAIYKTVYTTTPPRGPPFC
ncbi:hypothetical protein ACFO3O_11210 [Dokdonia ponticola]|uniref:Uncharacterized protein n=1 Tax=Dokdonia ponticola TaxID=2041041 RepID=A0ABV9HWX0_9FLAO